MNELNPAYVESVIRKAKEGKLTTGQAEIHTGPEPSVEEIRFKNKERLETNNPIMTHGFLRTYGFFLKNAAQKVGNS